MKMKAASGRHITETPPGDDVRAGGLAVATFYRFVRLVDCRDFATVLERRARSAGLCGTLILAPEGINATLAGERAGLLSWLSDLRRDHRFADLSPRLSDAAEMPFYRLKVKVRREIVTLARPDIDPGQRTGIHVSPGAWDRLLEDPEVVVIDTRNRYEVSLGSFPGALDPDTGSFHEFPAFVDRHLDPALHRKVAMFCTGGIRCEKASAWMLEQGFDEVYQLSGGILAYLAEKSGDQGRWQGSCFLFDQRVSVGYGLERDATVLCHGCRHPLTASDLAAPGYEEGVSCRYCTSGLSSSRRRSRRERHRQELLARRRGERHIGNRQS